MLFMRTKLRLKCTGVGLQEQVGSTQVQSQDRSVFVLHNHRAYSRALDLVHPLLGQESLCVSCSQ